MDPRCVLLTSRTLLLVTRVGVAHIMDDVLQIIKREIALDCDEGSTLSQVWSYVDLAQWELHSRRGTGASLPTGADSAFRGYVWQHVVRQRELIFASKESTIYDGTDPAGADSTKAKRFLCLSAAEVEEHYPELIVRASLPAIYRELFGREEGNERVVASANAYKFLTTLSRAREKGITQFRLAKDLNVDPRSAYHFVNVLDTYGLIVKYATFENGSNTKLLVLRRFTSEAQGTGGQAESLASPCGQEGSFSAASVVTSAADQESGEMTRLVRTRMRKRISDILQATECGYMVETDILDALGLDIWKEGHRKYFHRVLRDLNSLGHVETLRIRLPDKLQHAADDGEGASDDDSARDEDDAPLAQPQAKPNGSRKRVPQEAHSYRRCVRFIKPYVENHRLRASQGIPLHAKAGLSSYAAPEGSAAGHESGDDDDPDSERDGGGDGDDDDDNDSDEMDIDADTVKEKGDINNMLSKPQVAVGILASLPVDMQVFRMIALSGRHGIVTKAIQFLLGLDYRQLTRSLVLLEETPVFNQDGGFPGLHTSEEDRERNRQHLSEKLITHVEENLGREHRKRFFANPLAQPLMDRLTADYTCKDDGAGHARAAGRHARAAGDMSKDGPASLTGPAIEPHAAETAAADSDNSDGDGSNVGEQALLDGTDVELNSIVSGCSSLEDVHSEAMSRKVRVGLVIRERVLLQLLEHEPVFAISQRTALRCGKVCKQYLEMHKHSGLLPPTMVAAAQKHILDKRTFLRTVEGLADRGLVWLQTIMVAPDEQRPTDPKCVRLVIARSVDPSGALVETFVNQMRDKRTLNAQTYPTVPRSIDNIMVIPRTEGAEMRDRELEQRAAAFRAKRKQGPQDTSADPRRAHGALEASLTKRARLMLDELKQTSDAESGWAQILRRLRYPPHRVGRMVDLLTYLVSNLPGQVDGTFVFENCAFRSGYIFSRLPLELFIELCGGVRNLSVLVPYIRYGAALFDMDRDMDVDGESTPQQSALEEIRERLEAPVECLPRAILKRLKRYLVRSRLHIQHLLLAMQVLQLIRPIHSAKDIISMPEPPDAREAFRRMLVGNPKILCFGYQLIGKARLLTREGYSQALNAYKQDTPVIVDLTGCYLNDETYDLFAPLGLFRYLGDLEASAREAGRGLPGAHPLFGIGFADHWKRPVILRAAQTQVLDRFVDSETFATPLDNLGKLQEAAAQAEVTLDEARRYYQHAHVMALRAANRRIKDAKRHSRIRERVKQARAALARKKAEEAAAKAIETAAAGARGSQRRRRMAWSEDEDDLVAVSYAVLRHHARMYGHPFFLHDVVSLFPSRAHTANPAEAIRQRWARARQDPECKARSDSMHLVWSYVFRDAVANGELEDSPEVDVFDAKAAVTYFAGLLRRTPLEALLEKYADEIANDSEKGLYQTSMLGGGWSARRAWGSSKAYHASRVARARTSESDRLPATMQGSRVGYVVSGLNTKAQAQGQSHYGFGEDVLKVGQQHERRRDCTYSAMLTTHCGLRSTSDYSCPVTTRMANLTIGDSTAGDGTPAEAATTTIAYAADQPPHPDSMGMLLPLERVFDATALTGRIEALLLGASEEGSGEPDIAYCDEQGYWGAKSYAEIACLQTAIINLTLTPDDEYSVETGHKLLAAKQAVATRAFTALNRNMAVTRLRGMASSAGLSAASRQPGGDGDGDGEQHQRQLQQGQPGAPTQETLQMVVVHETTGTTRVRTRTTTATQGAHHSSADANAGPVDVDMEVDAESSEKAPGAVALSRHRSSRAEDIDEERRVPGRGFSASDKFLGAITTTLPSGFFDIDCAELQACTRLDRHLSAAEFGYVCSLVGQSRLWLRPAYDAEHIGSLHGLAGFRRQEAVPAMEFGVSIVTGRLAGAEIDDGDEAVDDTAASAEDEAASEADLAPGPLAVALRLAAGVVHTLGPLGASVHELAGVFSQLASGNAEAVFAQVSPSVRDALVADARLAALLRVLALRESVYAVGSGDVRYVSAAVYHKHWMVAADDTEAELAPRLGLNLSGSTNETFTWGLLATLLGHIVDSPGISLAALMRRHFAPFIPRFEVLCYLRVLAALGIVDTATSPEPDADPGDPRYPLQTTYYAPAPGYHRRLNRIARCSAMSEVQPLPPL
ncbi:hypothetical protein LPJ61_001005 [Coemansia biformis]|uniref:B-block binding subunit of TFIIIC domain-containing protein n=1 Tax=Coemansia biformis TaxID=1286918 RepID=A0A9W7YAS7_9FUNG|nr:hypothetical protein LPJ61_001005 [Coemansia biformis]